MNATGINMTLMGRVFTEPLKNVRCACIDKFKLQYCEILESKYLHLGPVYMEVGDPR